MTTQLKAQDGRKHGIAAYYPNAQNAAQLAPLILAGNLNTASGGAAPVLAAAATATATRQGAADRQAFAAAMLAIFTCIVSCDDHNFCGARIPILHLPQWAALCHHDDDYRTLSFLTYGFPAGYAGPVPTPSHINHPSALNHNRHVASYVCKELGEGAMLGPFDAPPFSPWTQTNPLLTREKKDSTHHRVIMDLSWLLPPGINVNGGTPRDCFLGAPQKMHLPSAGDYCDLIRKAGRGCYLYATDVARAYRQLPLDPADWPLICFQFEGRYFVDISLPFGLRWAASHCQDVTSLVAAELWRQGLTLLNYIDDFGVCGRLPLTCPRPFLLITNLLSELGLQEATHKASPL